MTLCAISSHCFRIYYEYVSVIGYGENQGKKLFQLRKSLKVRQTMTLCHAEDYILYIFRYVSAFSGRDFLEAEQHISLKTS